MQPALFTAARRTLTLWYCLILFILLATFSIALYGAQSQNFVRVVLQRDFGNKVPKTLTKFERKEILEQVKELRQGTLQTLLIIDGVLLFFGAGLSYLLAGKTLEPIERMHEQQKEFLANVSHELRTPLAAIQTSSEVALRSKKSSTEYRFVLEQTYEEVKRLGAMVNDLMLLSRADANSVSFNFSSCNLKPILEETLRGLELLAKQKSITISSLLSDTFVSADHDRIKQLFLIFLDNAIKYTPHGGKITVVLTPHPRPTVKISDTGVGLSLEEQQKIFTRFYRADASRSTQGAGLGLSIAKWIADEHNAKISVQSEKGNGSTFTMVFPVEKR